MSGTAFQVKEPSGVEVVGPGRRYRREGEEEIRDLQTESCGGDPCPT